LSGQPLSTCWATWRSTILRIASGKVVAGRVELDGELPEGASVTVLAFEGDETFEADAETEKMLLKSMVQCDDGRTTPLARLRCGNKAKRKSTPASRMAKCMAEHAKLVLLQRV